MRITRANWPIVAATVISLLIVLAVVLPVTSRHKPLPPGEIKSQDLVSLALALLDYATAHEDRVPAFTSDNPSALTGDWSPDKNQGIAAALSRPWKYRVVPEAVGRRISELSPGEPFIEVVGNQGEWPSYVDINAHLKKRS